MPCRRSSQPVGRLGSCHYQPRHPGKGALAWTRTPFHDRSILSAVLHEWGRCGSAEDGVETRVVIDWDRDTYRLQSIGWQNDRRISHTAFHARIVNDSLWIEWDGTHPGLMLERQHRGVLRDRIVLGWLHPAMREPPGATARDAANFSGGVWQLNVRRHYQTILKAVVRENKALERQGLLETLMTPSIYDDEHADYRFITVGIDRRRGIRDGLAVTMYRRASRQR